jgi:methylmalonyl-CoA/ethylmalonyl-CoA epimerase
VAPRNETSPVTRVLQKRTAILNHVAYLVTSLDAEEARLRRHGCMPIGTAQPAIAYGGRRIQFLMSPLDFILELIEAPDHRHAYGPAAASR